MKRLFHYIERVQPITAYHGTTDEFLREILKKGMVPDPTRKNWSMDVESSLGQISLASLGGSYWTTNLMTAMSSSTSTTRKFGGEPIIIIAKLIPESAIADEDDITNNLTREISSVMFELKYFISKIDNIALIFGDINYKDILKTGSKLLAKNLHQRWSVNPDKQPIPWDLFENALSRYLERQAVFGVPYDITEGSWKENYLRGYEYSVKDQDTLEWDKIPLPEELFGSKADVEMRFKKVQDDLTKYYRQLAKKTRDDMEFNATFRILEPVTYSGRNRIICIIRMVITDNEFYRTLEVVYGAVPRKFIEDYEQKVGEPHWKEE